MKISALFVLVALLFTVVPVRSGDLTPEQIESLRRKLAMIKENLDGHLSGRNRNARSVFMDASKSARAAVNLFLECHKKVNFEMEGRTDSEFRMWKEKQEDAWNNHSTDRPNRGGGQNMVIPGSKEQFAESLMLLLRYLALSCHAAEVEELDEVFAPLSSYVEDLTKLKELPHRMLTQDVSQTVFARAFELEELLGQNKAWDPVAFNIPGIYDKTILPYLRKNNPGSLMNAWDKRIEQEKRLVLFFEEKKKEELRGLDRDKEFAARNRQSNQGGILGSHDLDDFTRETLPRLTWGKYRDMYEHVDQLEGAKAMLKFVEENLTTPLGEQFFNDFMRVLDGPGEESATAGSA